MLIALTTLLVSATALGAVSQSISAQVLTAGTPIEVRLSVPTGSRISHPGDPVQATVISPVYGDDRLLIPQGAIASGKIEKVERLGLGFKYLSSGIEYRFDKLETPDGQSIPINARVFKVETAKEHVDAHGVVDGISPIANLSSGVAPYLLPALCLDPHLGMSFLGVKVMIARSPDPEIYYPAGTEAVLKLSEPATIQHSPAPIPSVPPLSPSDLASVHQILNAVGEQQTIRGRNHPSDLVNLLLFGSRESIAGAFQAAGWAGAQRRSILSLYRMYHSMVQRAGYAMAPMSRLTLNGAPANFEYQKSLNTFSKRHHARLWRLGGDDAWLSTATEDVNYKLRDMHLTHATDPFIDNERNKVINDLAFTGCLASASFIDRSIAHSQTPAISTDGRIAVLRIGDCQKSPAVPADHSAGWFGYRSRPVQILVALRNDLIRMNPAFLVYQSCKLLWVHEASPEESGARMLSRPQRTQPIPAALEGAWTRPSVLDIQAVSVTHKEN